ncbi:Phosphodiester glycosidase family protein [Candidatus Trichorickettsia mobilis]|uniref:Phosphodiester glycosidase family protein n=1 Tax=Candidatus Trichorickettsia mobilis TaxID=1346319 RepID=A0ABZ0UWX3_9RICK|nr:phosphodiester glycosidase family protein [Candidatus Trichorickettsia mobilis]WPY01132.1 Phosphodiester glycosidase family protein [Candidatus Trichorickettsia mobilis]
MRFLNLSLFLMFVFNAFYINAADKSYKVKGLEYKKLQPLTHVIHTLTIDPALYRLELVKAHNGVFGRETVPAIALRKNAVAAINAGFFEIGNSEDGRPSGNLIINNKILSVAKNPHGSLILAKNGIDIVFIHSNVRVKFGNQEIKVDKVNQFVKSNDEIVLYNSLWGFSTLTPYDRNEFLISNENIITEIFKHGDSIIPSSGWVLSLPNTYHLPLVKVGDKIELNINFEQEQEQVYFTDSVMGIPILINEGKIVAELEKFGSESFTLRPHARTAIGLRADGTIVIVVAEHLYAQPLREVTLGQVQDMLRREGYYGEKLATTNVLQALAVVEQQLQSKTMVIGLTLPELAKLMLELGCIKALNLDGGGSSTMFLNGAVVNATVGDSDEGIGKAVLRSVSDALAILKR